MFPIQSFAASDVQDLDISLYILNPLVHTEDSDFEVVYDSRTNPMSGRATTYYITYHKSITLTGTGVTSASQFNCKLSFYINVYYDSSTYKYVKHDSPVIESWQTPSTSFMASYSSPTVTATKSGTQINCTATSTLYITSQGYFTMKGTAAFTY
jgi:hypothetical protein